MMTIDPKMMTRDPFFVSCQHVLCYSILSTCPVVVDQVSKSSDLVIQWIFVLFIIQQIFVIVKNKGIKIQYWIMYWILYKIRWIFKKYKIIGFSSFLPVYFGSNLFTLHKNYIGFYQYGEIVQFISQIVILKLVYIYYIITIVTQYVLVMLGYNLVMIFHYQVGRIYSLLTCQLLSICLTQLIVVRFKIFLNRF